MHSGLLVLCLVALSHAMPEYVRMFDIKAAPVRLRFDPYEETWAKFKHDFGRVFENEDHENARRSVFMANIQRMEKHNKEYYNMQKSYYMGINQFADMTPEEYIQYNKLKKVDESKKGIKCTHFMSPLNWELPSAVDWRKKGYVTAIKDQGQCGSCWAFSTTGSLEGQHFRKTGKLISLSEQQLVDCSGAFGNEGCNGGWMDEAFKYINYVGGLESEAQYPYLAEDEKCKFVKSKEVADLSGCKDIPEGSEQALARAVASQGPISVAIDASHESFQFYEGGVYDEPNCSSTELDHGVLVVGYGSLHGKEYWIVKNSWGESWGMTGYILMSRNKDNQCGIASAASFPVV